MCFEQFQYRSVCKIGLTVIRLEPLDVIIQIHHFLERIFIILIHWIIDLDVIIHIHHLKKHNNTWRTYWFIFNFNFIKFIIFFEENNKASISTSSRSQTKVYIWGPRFVDDKKDTIWNWFSIWNYCEMEHFHWVFSITEYSMTMFHFEIGTSQRKESTDNKYLIRISDRNTLKTDRYE